MIRPKVLVKGKFYAEDIIVTVNPVSNRKIDKTTEQKLKPLWDKLYRKAKSEGRAIWDGMSFRLNDVREEQGRLMIEVSPIAFSVRYPLSMMTSELEHLGEDYYQNGLCIIGFIKTSDGKFVFGKRGKKSLADNKIDLIGGMVEGVDLSTKGKQDLLSVNLREIKEELGIDLPQTADIFVIGIVLSGLTNVVVITYTELNIDSSGVRQFFNRESDDEMVDLVFVEKEDLQSFLPSLGGYKPSLVDLLEYIP